MGFRVPSRTRPCNGKHLLPPTLDTATAVLSPPFKVQNVCPKDIYPNLVSPFPRTRTSLPRTCSPNPSKPICPSANRPQNCIEDLTIHSSSTTSLFTTSDHWDGLFEEALNSAWITCCTRKGPCFIMRSECLLVPLSRQSLDCQTRIHLDLSIPQVLARRLSRIRRSQRSRIVSIRLVERKTNGLGMVQHG